MLKQLSIQNFTLIAQANIPFREGFTAITGETGAGKSVLLKALRVVCGDRTNSTMVRAGEEKAVVEASFNIKGYKAIEKILSELEIDDDDELIIRREIMDSGKSRARINGSVVSQADLARLGEELIQMHGQSEQLMLRDTRTHTQMLDEYANNGALLEEYSSYWNAWNHIQGKIEETKKRAQDLAAQKDFLKFQFEELSKANLKEGEEEELEEKVNAASKNEAERRYLDDIQNMLGNENGLLDQVQILTSKMRALATKLPRYEDDLKALEEVADPFEGICKDLLRLSPSKSLNATEIDRANGRIALIQKLKRKYRNDVSGLIALTEQRKKELDSLENLDADLEELARQGSKNKMELDRVAKILTTSRETAAMEFDKAVEEILHQLGMPKAVFKTSIVEEQPGPLGKDQIEFLLAPNPGEGQKSLQKAVSGGELSRVLLAIKSVMAQLDQVPLLIFDEVDSGISGEVGNKIGESLQKLGKHHQVLTITHLHQVACRAKNQLAVSKREMDGRTFTNVVVLDENSRIDELVRMLGGNSDAIREHAKQILEENQ
ncbi:MAG: DNA repair protein RecN [Fibrobacteraceae bacterium]|nr:DNA repair protein RecN [Fibrobacteraceae bacterium]